MQTTPVSDNSGGLSSVWSRTSEYISRSTPLRILFLVIGMTVIIISLSLYANRVFPLLSLLCLVPGIVCTSPFCVHESNKRFLNSRSWNSTADSSTRQRQDEFQPHDHDTNGNAYQISNAIPFDLPPSYEEALQCTVVEADDNRTDPNDQTTSSSTIETNGMGCPVPSYESVVNKPEDSEEIENSSHETSDCPQSSSVSIEITSHLDV